MTNAEEALEQIDVFLSKSRLKNFKVSRQELLEFIETNWAASDDTKYSLRYSGIIVGRMLNEYAEIKDSENLQRWMLIHDKLDNFFDNPDYITNWYKASIYFDAGMKEKALAFFQLSYKQNPEYIFSRKSVYSDFINQHFTNPNLLKQEEIQEQEETYFGLELTYWQTFFKQEQEQILVCFMDSDDEIANKPNDLQENTVGYLKDNQIPILQRILNSVLLQYPKLQKMYDYAVEDKAYFMPDISTIDGFSDVLSFQECFVMNVFKDDVAYLGFSFSSSWDQEHGLGIITYKERVVAVGSADVAFDTYKAQEDLEKYL